MKKHKWILWAVTSFLFLSGCDGLVLDNAFLSRDELELIAPETPGNLQVTSADGQLTATWDGVRSADGYAVYYSVDNDPDTLRHYKDTEDSSCVIKNLVNDRIYDVRVKAVNSVGESGYSSSARGIPSTAQFVPGAVNGFTFDYDDNACVLSWEPTASASYYEVFLSESADFADAVLYQDDDLSDIRCRFAGFPAGTSFYVWVRAVNAVGAGSLASAGTFSGSGSGPVFQARLLPLSFSVLDDDSADLWIVFSEPVANSSSLLISDISFSGNSSALSATAMSWEYGQQALKLTLDVSGYTQSVSESVSIGWNGFKPAASTGAVLGSDSEIDVMPVVCLDSSFPAGLGNDDLSLLTNDGLNRALYDSADGYPVFNSDDGLLGQIDNTLHSSTSNFFLSYTLDGGSTWAPLSGTSFTRDGLAEGFYVLDIEYAYNPFPSVKTGSFDPIPLYIDQTAPTSSVTDQVLLNGAATVISIPFSEAIGNNSLIDSSDVTLSSPDGAISVASAVWSADSTQLDLTFDSSALTDAANGTWSIAFSGDMPEDRAGNKLNTDNSRLSFNVLFSDLALPTGFGSGDITCRSGSSSGPLFASGDYLSTDTVVFGIDTSGHQNTDGYALSYSLDNGANWNAVGNGQFTINGLEEGQTYFVDIEYVRNGSPQQRTAVNDPVSFTVDRIPPTVSVAYSPSLTANAVTEQSLLFTFSESIGRWYYTVTESGLAPAPSAYTEIGQGSRIDLSGINGTYYIHIRFWDRAGNETRMTSAALQLQ